MSNSVRPWAVSLVFFKWIRRVSSPLVWAALIAAASPAWAPSDRGRAQIHNGSLAGDDGVVLRGFSSGPDTVNPNNPPPSILQGWRDQFHLNAVRYSCYRSNPAGSFPPGTTWADQPMSVLLPLMDTAVNNASQYGFYIIIDYHSELIPDQSDWTTFWQAVAPRYANRTHVLYEMANEYGSGWDPADYQASDIQWQKDSYQFIRSLAPSTLIITNSFAHGDGPMLTVAQQQASGPGAIDYSNACVGFHPYSADPSTVLAVQAQFPVFCTEGDPGNDGLGAPNGAWLETNGIGWLSLASDASGDPTTTGPGFSSNWPLDPNTSDGTGPGGQGGASSGPVAINSGGSATEAFLSDTDFLGGDTFQATGTIDLSAAQDPAPMAVYLSERWGPFSYTVPGLTPGASYTVRLHFAEIYWTQPGQRSFNVSINGNVVLTDFDIIATAGAAWKATIQSFTAQADPAGMIVLGYSQGSADWPKSSGIEVLAGAPSAGGLSPSGGSGSGGGGGTPTSPGGSANSRCGATGIEAVLLVGLLSLRRLRPA